MTEDQATEHGLTMIEVIVSITLLAVVLGATTGLVGRLTAGIGVASERDSAQQLTNATLEQAKAYGCGLVTGSEDPAVAQRWQAHCWNGLGDSRFSTTLGSITYQVVLHTAWRQIGATSTNGDGCVDTADRPNQIIVADADGLERDVSVAWTDAGILHSVTASAYESVPPDAVAYRDSSNGALELMGRPGQRASITLTRAGATAPVTVTRAIDRTGCALFPFLVSGNGSTAEWSIGGNTHNPVTVTAEAITSEPSQAIGR